MNHVLAKPGFSQLLKSLDESDETRSIENGKTTTSLSGTKKYNEFLAIVAGHQELCHREASEGDGALIVPRNYPDKSMKSNRLIQDEPEIGFFSRLEEYFRSLTTGFSSNDLNKLLNRCLILVLALSEKIQLLTKYSSYVSNEKNDEEFQISFNGYPVKFQLPDAKYVKNKIEILKRFEKQYFSFILENTSSKLCLHLGEKCVKNHPSKFTIAFFEKAIDSQPNRSEAYYEIIIKIHDCLYLHQELLDSNLMLYFNYIKNIYNAYKNLEDDDKTVESSSENSEDNSPSTTLINPIPSKIDL